MARMILPVTENFLFNNRIALKLEELAFNGIHCTVLWLFKTSEEIVTIYNRHGLYSVYKQQLYSQNNWRTKTFEREYNKHKNLNYVKLGLNLSTVYANLKATVFTHFMQFCGPWITDKKWHSNTFRSSFKMTQN